MLSFESHASPISAFSCKSTATILSTLSRDALSDDFMDLTDPYETSSNKMSESIPLEIDVKPKRRFFVTKEEKRLYVEDYKRKIKTELCKNWELKGFCKYGEKCCFAHGQEELKEKTHLHSNYKTKPCKQYFFQGSCPYGYRCQYMHNEIKKSEEKTKEFYDFLTKAFIDKQIYINFLTKKNESASLNLKKFENLIKLEENKEQIPNILRKRLPIFTKFSQNTKPNKTMGLIQKEKKMHNFSLII